MATTQGSTEAEDERESFHPLQSCWVWWFEGPFRKAAQQKAADPIKQVSSLATVEDFWRLYNNLTLASQLSTDCNYHFFKQGIRPVADDPQNARGGMWVIKIAKKDRIRFLEEAWLNTLLACIGDMFQFGDGVNGCSVSICKDEHRISLWTRTADDRDVALAIGRQFRELSGLPLQSTIEYFAHSEPQPTREGVSRRHRYKI